MNLKPSNILVKPPLSNPEGFVLTDYGYTFYRSYRRKNFFCCLSDKFESSDPRKYEWMAPEFMVHRSAFIRFNPFKTRSMIGGPDSRSGDCRSGDSRSGAEN